MRRLARKGIEDIGVHFFFPIPSTELFEYLERKGRIGPDDETLMAPLFEMGSAVDESRNFCDHMSGRQLTRWKYWVVANFYLTSWVTHPTRAFRVAINVIRGRQTSVLEKFLGDAVRRVVRRVSLPTAPGGDARPVLPY